MMLQSDHLQRVESLITQTVRPIDCGLESKQAGGFVAVTTIGKN